MAAVLIAAIAADISFVHRGSASVRTDFEDMAIFSVGYTYFPVPVEHMDAPVPLLELYEGAQELGVALEVGSKDYLNLGLNGAYFWGDIGLWGGFRAGDVKGGEVGGLKFLGDYLAVTASFKLYALEALDDDAFGFLRFGAKYLLYVDQAAFFFEGELGPVFEPDDWDFDLSGTIRYFFNNEFGVGVRFSTYGDEPFFPDADFRPGEGYLLFLGEYYMAKGVGFKAAVGGAAKKTFLLQLGADYRF